jgi:hypothetical protein
MSEQKMQKLEERIAQLEEVIRDLRSGLNAVNLTASNAVEQVKEAQGLATGLAFSDEDENTPSNEKDVKKIDSVCDDGLKELKGIKETAQEALLSSAAAMGEEPDFMSWYGYDDAEALRNHQVLCRVLQLYDQNQWLDMTNAYFTARQRLCSLRKDAVAFTLALGSYVEKMLKSGAEIGQVSEFTAKLCVGGGHIGFLPVWIKAYARTDKEAVEWFDKSALAIQACMGEKYKEKLILEANPGRTMNLAALRNVSTVDAYEWLLDEIPWQEIDHEIGEWFRKEAVSVWLKQVTLKDGQTEDKVAGVISKAEALALKLSVYQPNKTSKQRHVL